MCFSGCGATGRLAILLEAMWRDAAPAGLQNAVYAIMTGGDFALVKSVEFFEDYCEVGARQVADADFTAKDMLVGITATGETASIVGSAIEAATRGARRASGTALMRGCTISMPLKPARISPKKRKRAPGARRGGREG